MDDQCDGVTPPVPGTAREGPISHAIFRVARLHRMCAGQLLREVGLHPGQELLLMHLWETGPQRQADLVPVLGSDSATVARTVQRLERAGFVRRTRSEHDRRAFLIEPTVASQALRGAVERIWRTLEEHTTAGLSETERAEVSRLLGRLEDGLATRGSACTEAPAATETAGPTGSTGSFVDSADSRGDRSGTGRSSRTRG